ncbi:MAG TPA: CNNM domain-containing protein [Verrucomicrobiae bacterium]
MSSEFFIWALFAVCLVLSFLLSGMEAGVFALSRLRIRQQMRAGRRSAKLLHDYLEHPENFLWTILVGNTLANFFILGWLVFVWHHTLQGHPVWFALVYFLIAVVFYAVSDLLPKMLFRSYPTRLCILLVRPFRLVHLVLRPLVAAVESASDFLLRWRGGKVFTGRLFGNREELRLLMQESAQTFTSEERAMINRVLDLQSLTVRQAMTPFSQAVTVGADEPVGRALELARERNLTRLPVLAPRDGHQRVVGLVNINAVLFDPEPLRARPVGDLVKPALFLEEDLRLELALRRLQRSGQHLAIVLGRDRRESGIIGLEDVLKVIFGEVRL